MLEKGRQKMARSVSMRQICSLFMVALAVRCIFFIWDYTGYYIVRPNYLSTVYFMQGYGIVAGYGYIRPHVDTPAYKHFSELRRRISKENVRSTSKFAGPIPEEGLYPEMLHPPGYPILIAAMNMVFGRSADLPIKVFGLILDTISALFLMYLATLCFETRIGLMAGYTYALFLPLAFYSCAYKLPIGLMSFFVLSSSICIVHSLRSGGRSGIFWLILAGLILGIASYLRPDYALLPVFMFLGLWAYKKKFIKSLLSAVTLQVVVILVLVPWAYRNYSICGRLVFTSSSTGATLISALAMYGNHWDFSDSDEARHEEAKSQGFVSAWSPEADSYFQKLFREKIMQNPYKYLKSIAIRLPFTVLTSYELGYNNPYRVQAKNKQEQTKHGDRIEQFKRNTSYFFAAYWDRLLTALFNLLCWIAVVTLAVRERRQWGLVLVILSPHLYALATHVLSSWQTRFVVPSVWCWLLSFGYGFNVAMEKLKTTGFYQRDRRHDRNASYVSDSS